MVDSRAGEGNLQDEPGTSFWDKKGSALKNDDTF